MPTSSRSSLALAFMAGAAAAGAFAFAVLVSKRIRKSRSKQDAPVPAAEAHLWKVVANSFTAALIYAGDKLDLYELLWENGPITASNLAKLSGFDERWLTEWLAQATAAGLCTFEGDATKRFALRGEYASLLRGPEREERSMVGMFQALHVLVQRAEVTARAIRTGVGVDYDGFHDDRRADRRHMTENVRADEGVSVISATAEESFDLIHGIDRKNRNFFIYHLVEDLIEKVTVPSTGEKLVAMLERGVAVADIGCGCGTSTIQLARRFPKSQFYGYELSPKSLETFANRVKEDGIANVTICDVNNRSVGDGPHGEASNSFSFVYSHDLLHDMTSPKALIKEVKARLVKDGCWVIVDVECGSSLSGNIARPSAALSYGFSCLLCLCSATAVPGGEGLGTLGFHPALARRWMREAGFRHFHEMKIKSRPENSCFIIA